MRGLMDRCTLCPRRCGANRNEGEKGACGIADHLKVAAVNLHPWEEPPISGSQGSGAIFFSGCSLRCVFCQNYPISQMGIGRHFTVEGLAREMLDLQKKGAHNLNLVTGTQQIPWVIEALLHAVPRGLSIPLVYNSSGYECLEVIRLLEGIVDIYLPDIKYADPAAASFCSMREDYVRVNRRALLEMWKQVGELRCDSEGVAVRGMLVRHLVLPGDLSGTRDCLYFLSTRMGPSVWVSLMNQYFPAYLAMGMPPLDRKVSLEEYEEAEACLEEFGLVRGFVQERCEDEWWTESADGRLVHSTFSSMAGRSNRKGRSRLPNRADTKPRFYFPRDRFPGRGESRAPGKKTRLSALRKGLLVRHGKGKDG
ncbi:MAG: radical SAM protein [Syntrophobacteraceae bacterium]|nr:radical SAM protein [Syntrophobacteraceae bacterium]